MRELPQQLLRWTKWRFRVRWRARTKLFAGRLQCSGESEEHSENALELLKVNKDILHLVWGVCPLHNGLLYRHVQPSHQLHWGHERVFEGGLVYNQCRVLLLFLLECAERNDLQQVKANLKFWQLHYGLVSYRWGLQDEYWHTCHSLSQQEHPKQGLHGQFWRHILWGPVLEPNN